MTCGDNNFCSAISNIAISSNKDNDNNNDTDDTATMGTAISISSSSVSSSSLEYDCNSDTEEEEESTKYYDDDDDDDNDNDSSININIDTINNNNNNDNDVDDICDDDNEERKLVFTQMKLLEQTTYKRPHYNEIPDMFRGVWRKQIVEWMYVLIKHCKLRKETTAAAIYYLDVAVAVSSHTSTRKMGNNKNNLILIQTPKDYQLCAMTALHLALKVYDSPTVRIVKLNCLVKLSNNEFTAQDIIQKEKQLINNVLHWRLHPPTSNCFLYRYLELLPPSLLSLPSLPVVKEQQQQDQQQQQQTRIQQQDQKQTHQLLEESASEIIEVALAHDRFLTVPSSVIAYSALLLAMELNTTNNNSSSSSSSSNKYEYDWSTFVHNMKNVAGMGDIFFMNGNNDNDNKDDNDNNNNISRSVLRTKMLLDRIIIQGLPLLPEGEEEEDDEDTDDGNDDESSSNTAVTTMTMTRIKSMGSLSSGDDDDDDEPSNKSTQPPSPTSTMSSSNTTTTANTATTATTTTTTTLSSSSIITTAARSRSTTMVASPPL